MPPRKNAAAKPEKVEALVMPLWPDAGRALGLGRNATYEAVARGEIPVIRFGRRIVVPKAKLLQLVGAA